MLERWMSVPGFRGAYQVSDQGRVFSAPRVLVDKRGRVRVQPGKMLTGWPSGKWPYPSVALWRDKKRKVYRIARLVLLTFVGPPSDPRMQASHEPNPDPLDNRLCNLKWRSHAENMEERDQRGQSEREIDAISRRETEDSVDPRPSEEEDSFVPF